MIIVAYSDTTFIATFSVYTLVPTDPIIFNYPVLNPGGHYDVTSGIYTVPLDGTYQFIINIYSNGDDDIRPRLIVDNMHVSLIEKINHLFKSL